MRWELNVTLQQAVAEASLASKQPLVDIKNVGKIYGDPTTGYTALEAVDFTILENEFFTLLGPSGCGKTTLLRMIAGFETPTSGNILLDGTDLSRLSPQRRQVNTVFQSYALFPFLTVWENVAFGLRMLGWEKQRINKRVEAMLAVVRMEEFARRRPSELSGGQQQRVALARALAPSPRLLLLDEPLSALDLKLRRGMQQELKRLQRETGITFVLVTHDQEEAMSMADRVAVMSAGHVLQIGKPNEIYDRPETRFVADFIGEANIFPQSFTRNGKCLAIRPERIRVILPADSSVRGRLTDCVFLGSDVLYEVELEGGGHVRAKHRSDELTPWPVGSAVGIVWPTSAERWVVE